MDETGRARRAPVLDAAALAALLSGSRIDAIKRVREVQGIGLKEAKEMVDAYVASHPDLAANYAAASAEAKGVVLRWLAVIILMVVGAWYLFRK